MELSPFFCFVHVYSSVHMLSQILCICVCVCVRGGGDPDPKLSCVIVFHDNQPMHIETVHEFCTSLNIEEVLRITNRQSSAKSMLFSFPSSPSVHSTWIYLQYTFYSKRYFKKCISNANNCTYERSLKDIFSPT